MTAPDVAARPALAVDGVRVRFGGNVAVDGVTFDVDAGRILGLVGPNGAGKTTLFNAVSGLVPVAEGHLRLGDDGTDLTTVGAHRRPGLGIGRTFQDSRLVDGLPVLDQLCCGAFTRSRGPLGAILRTPGFLREERENVERAHAILDDLGIADRAATSVDVLSAPERRLVDLGRALMSRPRLLLLDEISAGMPPDDRALVAQRVREQVDRHATTVVFVEHDMAFVRSLAERVVVMAEGAVLADGEPAAVLARPDVLEAYIGPGALGALQ